MDRAKASAIVNGAMRQLVDEQPALLELEVTEPAASHLVLTRQAQPTCMMAQAFDESLTAIRTHLPCLTWAFGAVERQANGQSSVVIL